MRKPAAFFPIALALAALTLASIVGARAQDSGQEGPTKIDQCQTISQPGSYKLVNNLTFTGPVPATTVCLNITTSFVTIDLAGFSISGPGFIGTAILAAPPSGSPVTAATAPSAPAPLLGIAVRNGSVSGFSLGVNLDAANGSIVEGLRVVGPLFLGISARGIVRGNTVTNVASGNGIFAQGTVTGNTADGNAAGFFIESGSTVIGNTATNNSGAVPGPGIAVDCPSNVTDNTAVNNPIRNLVLSGNGCNNTNNVAP